jgi:hypothetical protein
MVFARDEVRAETATVSRMRASRTDTVLRLDAALAGRYDIERELGDGGAAPADRAFVAFSTATQLSAWHFVCHFDSGGRPIKRYCH